MAYIQSIRDTNGDTIDVYSKILADNIAEQFNTSRSYPADSYVFHESILYKSRVNQNAGPFVSSNWERVTIADMIRTVARTLIE